MDTYGISKWCEERQVKVNGKEFVDSQKWIRSGDFYRDYLRFTDSTSGYKTASQVAFSKVITGKGGIKDQSKRPNPDLPPKHPEERTVFWRNLTWESSDDRKSALERTIKGKKSTDDNPNLPNY